MLNSLILNSMPFLFLYTDIVFISVSSDYDIDISGKHYLFSYTSKDFQCKKCTCYSLISKM